MEFTLDPESIAFHFDIKTNSVNTVGGQVVQVFGTRISDIIVTGSFGTGGWQAQQEWLSTITNQMNSQIGTFPSSGAYAHSGQYKQGTPINFSYPPRGWNFNVYILSYTQPDSQSSVMMDNSIINPRWTLTLFPVQDNSSGLFSPQEDSSLKSVTDAALASYLNRLSTGIGWVPNQYNP